MEFKCIKDSDGTKRWLNELDQLHRLDGPAYEDPDGINLWFKDGDFHRSDGPAVEYADGRKEWWVNGERHRIDGPAYESVSGLKAWYVKGQEITEWIKEHGISNSPTQEEQVLIRLTWG